MWHMACYNQNMAHGSVHVGVFCLCLQAIYFPCLVTPALVNLFYFHVNIDQNIGSLVFLLYVLYCPIVDIAVLQISRFDLYVY